MSTLLCFDSGIERKKFNDQRKIKRVIWPRRKLATLME